MRGVSIIILSFVILAIRKNFRNRKIEQVYKNPVTSPSNLLHGEILDVILGWLNDLCQCSFVFNMIGSLIVYLDVGNSRAMYKSFLFKVSFSLKIPRLEPSL